jgi:hypothetical protein
VVALGATLVLGGLAGCGGGAVHVSSNLRLALRHLVAARAGVVSTQFLLSGPGEFVPPVLYVTRFDQAAKRAEVKVDLRPFMSLYELTLPPSSRIGKVKDWRFDAITDNSHGLVMYLASPLFEEPTFQGRARLTRAARGRLGRRLVDGQAHPSHVAAVAPGAT